MTTQLRSVHIASLGCARNDVDSEELAARLELGGFTLVADPENAELQVALNQLQSPDQVGVITMVNSAAPVWLPVPSVASVITPPAVRAVCAVMVESTPPLMPTAIFMPVFIV